MNPSKTLLAGVVFASFVASASFSMPAYAQPKDEKPHIGTGKNESGETGLKRPSLYKPKKIGPKQVDYMKKVAIQKLKRLPEDLVGCVVRLWRGSAVDRLARIPNGFDILKVKAAQTVPSVENSLSFANLEESYSAVCSGDSNFHCCWGHTTTTRKFSMLAFFKTNWSGETVPVREENPKAWMKYYFKKIDRVLNGRATIFPGYANLHEFSSEPEFELYLKEKVIEQWGNLAVKINLSNIAILMSNRFKTYEREMDKVIASLKEEIAKGYNPKIYFTAANSSPTKPDGKAIHVVQVYDVVDEKPDGSAKICIWDISKPANECRDLIRVEANGDVFYDRWADPDPELDEKLLSDVKMTPENKEEIAGIALELWDFCKKNPKFCGPK